MSSLSAIVKQVVSGDTVKIRNKPKNGPPIEKTLILMNINAPKLGYRKKDDVSKEEPYAWETREFLRKKLIGQEVTVWTQGDNSADRIFGNIFFPKDKNITEELVENGLVTVRSGNMRSPSVDLQTLMELEKKAKTEGKGKWAPNAKTTGRNVTFVENPEMTLKHLKNKQVNAVIENVITGSTVSVVLLPDFYYVTLLISGVRCESPNDGDGIGSEAKFFVECRLLQKDVQVIIEGFKGNNVVGSIVHPKGDIAELLLKEGFAGCVDNTMVNVTHGSDKLRAAERYAKENHVRKWQSWEPSNTKIANKEFQGIVQEIISGDGLVIKLNNGETKRIFLSSIRPPRQDVVKKENEDPNEPKAAPAPRGAGRIFEVPWLFEAREFLRKKLIGKKVQVIVDYIQKERDNFPEKLSCTVLIGGTNVAESMVSQGLATVFNHRQDDENRSPFYDVLQSAQQKAAESHKGLHSKEIPKHRINDLTQNPTRAKGLIPIFQRVSRLEAIVEYVAGGARMRLFIPRDSVVLTFLLSGISCPKAEVTLRSGTRQEADPCGNEALKFTKEKVIQRDVEIKIESCDKAGNMIGWMFVNGANLSVSLVEEGLAKVHSASAERSEYYRQLVQAEDAAKANKLNIWQHPQEEVKEEVLDDSVVRDMKYRNVLIEVITPELHVFAQYTEDETELLNLTNQLRDQMKTYGRPSDYRPRKGELCAAKFTDDEWYRGKVQKLMGPKAQVLYVDYGNSTEVSIQNLAPLPPGLNVAKPFAHEYGIACVKPAPKEYTEEAILGFLKQITGRVLAINVEYYEQNLPYISIVDAETKDDEVEKAIRQGYFLVANRREKKLQQLLDTYNDAQREAKKKHAVIWEYGDITEDDAKEFGLGNK